MHLIFVLMFMLRSIEDPLSHLTKGLKRVAVGAALLCGASDVPSLYQDTVHQKTFALVNNINDLPVAVQQFNAGRVAQILLEPYTLMYFSTPDRIEQSRTVYTASYNTEEHINEEEVKRMLLEIINSAMTDVTALSLFGNKAMQEITLEQLRSISEVTIDGIPSARDVDTYAVYNSALEVATQLVNVLKNDYGMTIENALIPKIALHDSLDTNEHASDHSKVIQVVSTVENYPIDMHTISLKLKFRGEYQVVSIALPVFLCAGLLYYYLPRNRKRRARKRALIEKYTN